jgi:hypothetical protein
MRITEGANGVRRLGSGLNEILGPRFRATERAARSNPVRLDFAYRGEAEGGSQLEGGEYRIQIGLKMLAQDPCNLLYVMWRVYPEERVVVSVKRNPGQHTSAECGNGGYVNVASVGVPSSRTARGGVKRSLLADYNPASRELILQIDGAQTWRGYLPVALLNGLAGPSGIRSDNGQFRFRLFGDIRTH